MFFHGKIDLTSRIQLHSEEPPQKHNKSVKKMFFFHGNIYMVGTVIEKSLI